MIELRDVTKTYLNGARPAVDHLNLEVRPGEIFGFLGPNGAGKTTTIRMIVGLLRPDTGRITVAGADVARDPLRAKARIGFVPDTPEVWDKLTGLEFLNFMADIYRVPGPLRRRRIEELAEAFEMTSALGDRVGSYSHGMQQKLVLMGALLHSPPVWILDEPMVGLDPRAAFRLKELMAEHCRQGNTVFFSTHVLEVAERLCHRVGIIRQGRLIAQGTLEELRRAAAGETQPGTMAGRTTGTDPATGAPGSGLANSLEQIFLELTGQ